MGMFDKLRGAIGEPSGELLAEGLLGRGIITGVRQTSLSTGSQWNPSHVCEFTLEVSLDNTPRYSAECRQAIPAQVLPRLGNGTSVAVRVDPGDPAKIALPLGEEPPVVTAARSGDANAGSAADVLANGSACRAVVVQSQELGKRNAEGIDLYGLLLTVFVDGRAPYQATVGNPVPPEAVPLLYPGNNVPAKYMPGQGDNQIVIDWAAALHEASAGRPA